MDRFVVDGLRGHPGLLEALETLRQVVLDGGEGGHDSWRAKPVGGVREVGQVALDHIYTFEAINYQFYLDLWFQDHRRLRVAQRGSVLVQQVHQLLRHNPGGKEYSLT